MDWRSKSLCLHITNVDETRPRTRLTISNVQNRRSSSHKTLSQLKRYKDIFPYFGKLLNFKVCRTSWKYHQKFHSEPSPYSQWQHRIQRSGYFFQTLSPNKSELGEMENSDR